MLGAVTALFFRCLNALLHPIHRTTKGIKWGLVAHTFALFSFLTIDAAINRGTLSISYIDNREFPGVGGAVPGPIGYETFILSYKAANYVNFFMLPLNQ